MVENLLMYMCAKHCHKRWSSDKAIAKIKRCSFFASQCRDARSDQRLCSRISVQPGSRDFSSVRQW